MNEKINDLKVKLFLDGASKTDIQEWQHKTYIKGLTTNPILLRKEGIVDLHAFAKDALSLFPDRPISLGVLADDFNEMEQQALKIASWGENVYVKIPVTNTRRETCYSLIKRLSAQAVKLNITAVMTLEQVRQIILALSPEVPSFISVFAGRIADTGNDPMPMMQEALNIMKVNPLSELIWASSRELFNIFQANAIGCHVITVTKDILKKLALVGYDLEDYSLDTVKMFYNEVIAAGLKLPV